MADDGAELMRAANNNSGSGEWVVTAREGWRSFWRKAIEIWEEI
jgi:hypothetical protein